MLVPLAPHVFVRTSVRGDLAENDITGELFELQKFKQAWTLGENEDGCWLNGGGGEDDSVWLEFDQTAMIDPETQKVFIVVEEDEAGPSVNFLGRGRSPEGGAQDLRDHHRGGPNFHQYGHLLDSHQWCPSLLEAQHDAGCLYLTF